MRDRVLGSGNNAARRLCEQGVGELLPLAVLPSNVVIFISFGGAA